MPCAGCSRPPQELGLAAWRRGGASEWRVCVLVTLILAAVGGCYLLILAPATGRQENLPWSRPTGGAPRRSITGQGGAPLGHCERPFPPACWPGPAILLFCITAPLKTAAHAQRSGQPSSKASPPALAPLASFRSSAPPNANARRHRHSGSPTTYQPHAPLSNPKHLRPRPLHHAAERVNNAHATHDAVVVAPDGALPFPAQLPNTGSPAGARPAPRACGVPHGILWQRRLCAGHPQRGGLCDLPVPHAGPSARRRRDGHQGWCGTSCGFKGRLDGGAVFSRGV